MFTPGYQLDARAVNDAAVGTIGTGDPMGLGEPAVFDHAGARLVCSDRRPLPGGDERGRRRIRKMLYLHETIDIIGDGQQAYLDTVGERASHSERQGVSRLMGTWKVIGSTARWPRVVNLWEMDSWSHWAEALERQFMPEKRDPHLGPWWSKATQWRSGGFDRILEPSAYSPTRDELRALGLRAWVCVQSIVRLMPGQRRVYLDAVGGELRPLLEARGLNLMGAYSVPMRSDEAIVVWAAPDFRFLCDIYARRANDAELQKWGAWASGVRRKFETTWLVPSADCFFHPGKA